MDTFSSPTTKPLYRGTQITWYILGIIEMLLVFRFILKLLAANPAAGFSSFIYTLRHTFASRLAEKGVALLTIKELMGHSDVRTTMRYAHLGQHTLRDAIKVLETSHVFDLRHHSVTHEDLGVTNSMLLKREITR